MATEVAETSSGTELDEMFNLAMDEGVPAKEAHGAADTI